MRQIKYFLKLLIPRIILEYRKAFLAKKTKKRGEIIRSHFLSLNKSNLNMETLQIVEYFEDNPFSVFPYTYTKKYKSSDIKVCDDVSCTMKYVIHKSHKLYFPGNFNCEEVRDYYNGILREQDEDSPHKYETPEYTVQKGDIIADIGSAEGMWALENAEKAERIYLFECDNNWIQALKKTFEPWKEKTIIVNKYVSNITKGNDITLDDFLNNNRINFIKADIEGAEIKLLKGAQKTLTNQKGIKLLLCTYHRQNDEADIKEFLKKHNSSVETSKGYMIYIFDENLDFPYVRRGLIRAKTTANHHDRF